MAYEVTATRRRPQRFDHLVGQDFVAATLKNSIAQERIAHAYLFSGPRGCGKTSSARILAKALNCERGPTAEPCGECSACKEIARGASIDVIEIDGASNTSINDIRQIKDEVIFPPNAARYKIYIIDEVHQLSTSAFNALLKTIEEPPPYIVFIFATTELHKVPATIKSRCQQFYFRLVAVEQIASLLREASSEMNIEADDEALFWIAREATGSIRDAYTLFDQVASFSDGVITWDKIRDKLGLVGVEKLNGLFEFCADGNAAEALLRLGEILEGGVSIEQFISDASDYFRALLFIQNGIKKESLLGQLPDRFSQKALAAWNAAALEKAFALFLTLYRDVRYSLEPRFELELAVSRIAYLASWVSPVELKAAIEDARAAMGPVRGGGAAQFTGAQQSGFAGGGARPFVERGGQNAGFEWSAARQFQPAQTENAPQSARDFGVRRNEQAAMRQITANPSLPVRELREEVLKVLSTRSAVLSSALAQTSDWVFETDTVIARAETGFLVQQLAKDSQTIASCIKDVWGKDARFVVRKIEVENEKNTGGEKKLPELVEWYRTTYKGTVMEEQS
jgi:DNA polymerase-3 subunit gamma/tau